MADSELPAAQSLSPTRIIKLSLTAATRSLFSPASICDSDSFHCLVHLWAPARLGGVQAGERLFNESRQGQGAV